MENQERGNAGHNHNPADDQRQGSLFLFVWWLDRWHGSDLLTY
jgi:hypothetical protein